MKGRLWEIPAMQTVTVDKYKRIRIPDVKPRQVFAYEQNGGRFTLTLVEPVQPKKAKLVRRNGKTYLVSDHSITNEDVYRAMADFP
jgi:hypothetical protein